LHHLRPILVAADDFNRIRFYACYDGLSHRIYRLPRKSVRHLLAKSSSSVYRFPKGTPSRP
jgi:hypothetical protein